MIDDCGGGDSRFPLKHGCISTRLDGVESLRQLHDHDYVYLNFSNYETKE
jgi:hypothetical protein